jgi:hypothetical protein
MQPDRRKHRAPFVADGSSIRTANGLPVGTMVTPQIAHFASVSMSCFDALTEALDLCRGEIDLEEVARMSPAIKRIRELRERVEQELRGTNN